MEVNENTRISDLTNAQLHELNQNLLDAATDVHRPLVDKIAPLSNLREEYVNPSFLQQIDWLKERGYESLRRTRGDGDCFYRSVAYSYIERLVEEPSVVPQALSKLEKTLPILESVGFQPIVYEDFYEIFSSLIQNITQPDHERRRLDKDMLLTAFQDPEVSNSVVVYLRLLTSAQIRSEPKEYESVLFHPELGEMLSVREFCESFVEAVGKEADHVQMSALAKALGINIEIAYLDGRSADVSFVKIESGTGAPLVLLYRPGHYDILGRSK